ncbi:MAG: helix-turn-helix transcriptional regulator [Rhodobacterales bacterium]|nr:helix-turn-helix transcriptional regulator [Rhodobacterales bacterium]
MTPFGLRIRELRRQRGLSLRAMAEAMGVSAAYLSALEHGRRGRPGSGFVMQVCAFFELIWDEAEELKRLAERSHPRVVVDTAGLSPKATELANLLSRRIGDLSDDTIDWIIHEIETGSAGRE